MLQEVTSYCSYNNKAFWAEIFLVSDLKLDHDICLSQVIDKLQKQGKRE